MKRYLGIDWLRKYPEKTRMLQLRFFVDALGHNLLLHNSSFSSIFVHPSDCLYFGGKKNLESEREKLDRKKVFALFCCVGFVDLVCPTFIVE